MAIVKILFLIDPNSTHDIKWVKYFSQQSKYECYFICREHHFSNEIIREVREKYSLIYLGTIDYFSITRPFKTLRHSLFIKQIIRNYCIELFHIQYAEPNILWAILKRTIKIPIIVTCRGTDVLKVIPEHFSKNDLLNQLVKRLYKLAFLKVDWITTTSKKQLDLVEELSGRVNNLSIIRTGVEISELKNDTSQYFRNEITKPFILFPRYIHPVYNHEFCLKALNLLDINLKHKFQMVFVGKGSGEVLYEEALIQMMGDCKDLDFIFLPKLKPKEIWELYKRAKIIIMTPISDGSPVSAMEAISLNKTVILGPLAYDVDIFENDLIKKLTQWDVTELRDKIEHSIQNPSKQMLDESIMPLINNSSNMLKLEKIYQSLTGSR